jgi:tRNA pseudouridine55 synthase
MSTSEISGFILVDKPVGMSSHAVVHALRRLTGVKRIGHAGTLDPAASGLLILAIGRNCTKQLGRFLKSGKEYEAEIELGRETDTYDAVGKTVKQIVGPWPESGKVESALAGFVGPQEQTAPMYSAKKVKGRKLYKLALKGQTVEIKPSLIEIYGLELLSYEPPFLRVRVACSSGTYIRSIAHDLGAVLGTGACLSALRRTKSGLFGISSAVPLNALDTDNLMSYIRPEL